MTRIDDIRADIDKTDDKIAALFAERMALVIEIASEKEKLGVSVLDSSRESAIKRRVSKILPEELKVYGEELFDKLFSLSRDYQRHRRGDN